MMRRATTGPHAIHRPRPGTLLIAALLSTSCTDSGGASRGDDVGARDAAAPNDAASGENEGDLAYAPAAVDLDGQTVVPMDILHVDAELLFEPAAARASARAVVTFEVGQRGRPFFDLRQTIVAAEIDGESIAATELAHRDLGGPEGSELRVMDRAVEPGEHELVVEYTLERPDVIDPGDVHAPELDGGSVRWGFNLADYTAAHFLEQWAPANLIFDRHSLRVEIELRGTDVEHTLVTTGKVSVLSDGHFEIQFPPSTAAHSPMLFLRPIAELSELTLAHELPDGMPVDIRVAAAAEADVNLERLAEGVAAAMDEFSRDVGPYDHGSTYTVLVWDGYSMEHDGGATLTFGDRPDATVGETMNPAPDLFRHELLHEWFGRGLQPVGQDHGWIDEAWVTYAANGPMVPAPLPADTPFTLVGESPFYRSMRADQGNPYIEGPQVFAAIADVVGTESLGALMRDFYLAHRGERYDTDLLERALYCGSGESDVREIFHRHVRGQTEAPLAPAPSCD